MSNHRRQLVQAISRALGYAAFCVLCSACLPAVAHAQTQCPVSLRWDTHEAWNTLAYFDLEYGLIAREPTQVLRVPAVLEVETTRSPNTTATVSVPQPPGPRVYYFQLRAVDTEGARSGPSNIVSKLFEATCGTTTQPGRPPQSLTGPVTGSILEG